MNSFILQGFLVILVCGMFIIDVNCGDVEGNLETILKFYCQENNHFYFGPVCGKNEGGDCAALRAEKDIKNSACNCFGIGRGMFYIILFIMLDKFLKCDFRGTLRVYDKQAKHQKQMRCK